MDQTLGLEALQKPAVGCESGNDANATGNKLTMAGLDDLNSSSTSSTMTECSDGRPTSAASASTPSDTLSLGLSTMKRGPGRPKKDDVEPAARKFHTRRTKSKRSHSSAVVEVSSGSSVLQTLSVDVPEKPVAVKQEQFLNQDVSSSSADLLPGVTASVSIKKEPPCEISSVNADAGDSLSRSSITPDESMVLDEMSFSALPEKKCALCNRGEKSLLGQGDLKRYEPTPGFNPFKRQLTRAGAKRALSDADDVMGRRGQQHLTWRRARGPLKQQPSEKTGPAPPVVRSISQPALDFDGRPLPPNVDELKHVGFVEDVEISQLFEKTGHVWAHHCCAAWSEGVIQAEDYSLRFVDKAVFSGLSQKCSYCQNYGATINCRYARCPKKYHYPCASGSGCFQDIKTMSLLCPDHTDEAVAIANQEAYCVVCDTPGNISDQLFCTSCGQHYHGNCLDPAVEVNPVVRAGWQCPECKICQTCRQPGDDNKMLVCDACDKGYHTFCLTPVMTTIPKNGWKCKNCRVCGDCGSRTPGSGPSSRWHLNYSVCDSCYQQRNKGLCCPVCGKAYRHFTTGMSKMLLCSQCKRHVHDGCDEGIDLFRTKPDDYVCLACKNRLLVPFDTGSMTDSIQSVADDDGLQDIENFGIFKRLKEEQGESIADQEEVDEAMPSSQESLVPTEDSFCSMDIDLNALEKGVQQLIGTPSPGHLDCNADGRPLSRMNSAGDGLLSKDTATHSSTSIRASRQGVGKPVYREDDEVGKKCVGTGRQRQTRAAGVGSAAGVGKKKRPVTQSTERKRGAKPKLKQIHCRALSGGSQDQNGKEDDHQQTIVLCSARDHFTLKQDMCLTCGSYGLGEEGKLIACVQCGQCYHPYCANIKISKIMLQKGWRCLDCTVCEGCGKPHDESRLILCDECDISYHIYCLDPPLSEVPTGTWKCKWCIMCVSCGATTPGGASCQWQNNYSQCAQCASLESCPICSNSYCEGELIIQCLHCQRWLHSICDGINTEDEAESAIDYGYHCLMCRPLTGALGPLPPVSPEQPATPIPPPVVPSPPPVQSVLIIKEPELPKTPKTFFLDGVCLSESGLSQIRALSLRLTEKKQRGRWRRTPSVQTHPALLLTERSEDDVETPDSKLGLLGNAEHSKFYANAEGDENKPEAVTAHEDWDILSPTLDRPPLDGSGLLEKKKKARIRVGIGGFMPRHRTRGGGQWRGGRTMGASNRPGNSLDVPQGVGCLEQEDYMRTDLDGKKLKQQRPRGRKVEKKKSHMEDNYPLYLQDAFFGRDLLDKCKDSQVDEMDLESDTDRDQALASSTTSAPIASATGPGMSSAVRFPSASAAEPMETTVRAASRIGSTSQELQSSLSWNEGKPDLSVCNNLGNLCTDATPGDDSDKDHNFDEADLEDVLPPEPLDEFINLPWEDIAPTDGEPSDLSDHLQVGARSSHEIAGLEAMLNTNLELPQIDNDALEVFLKNDSQNNFALHHAGAGFMEKSTTGQGDDTPSSSISPFSPSLTADDFPGLGFGDPTLWSQQNPAAGQFGSAAFPDLNMSSSVMSGGVDDADTSDNLSYNQRNVKKWEVDEPLGEMATISPVLYCNLRHPELKIQYPEWSERAKQISKLWRKVPTEQRVPYLAKARDNRATVRSQKSHKDVRRKPKESSSTVTQLSAPDLSRQTSIDQSESSNQSSLNAAADDKVKPEADAYSLAPHTPQTPPKQSSPSCGYNQPHHMVFKQPHPPVAMSGGAFDPYGHPMNAGNSRSMAGEMVSHQTPLHQHPHTQSTSPAQGVEGFHHQSPGTPISDHFMHQNVYRPSSGSPVTPGARPTPPGSAEPGVRQFPGTFHSPNTSSSPRYSDPFGGHAAKVSAEQPSASPVQEHYGMFPGGGVHQQQHLETYAQYGLTRSPSEQYPRPGMNVRDSYPMNPGVMMDPYGRSHMNPRSSVTADQYCRPPLTPSPSDPGLRSPLNQKSMPSDHYAAIAQRDPYSHAPMTPAPSDPYARPALTQAPSDQCGRPLSDPYARPPMTPSPADPYARPPMTPAPVDPYARPPMTPSPSDPYARPPGTPVASDPYVRPPATPMQSDPYARAPMTPAPVDPYARPPMTPAPVDPYARPPMTPRPIVSDVYLPSSSDPYVRPSMAPRPMMSLDIRPLAPNQPDPYLRLPMAMRPVSSEHGVPRPGMPLESAYGTPGAGRASVVGDSPDGQKQMVVRPGFNVESCSAASLMTSEAQVSHTPLYEYNYRLWQYGPQSAPVMEDEQLGRHQQSEVQRQQLRELLAKQTKQRQSKKKQEETRQQQHQKDPITSGSGSQLPLRHWPEDSNVLLTPTKSGFQSHDGAVRSPMTDFIGPGGPFVGRDMELMMRPSPHHGPMRMPHTGDNDNFGQRALQSGEVVRQAYPGPVRSIALRSLPPHPGMTHPQFAIQHRPMSTVYSEVPRHEVVSEQILPQSPQLAGVPQMATRATMPGQESMAQQPQSGFHPRMIVSQRPVGSPNPRMQGGGQYEGVIVSSVVMPSGLTSQPQHQQVMVPGGWFPPPEFYRPGNRMQCPQGPLQLSSRQMYPMSEPPHHPQHQLHGFGQSQMPVPMQTMPTGPLTGGQHPGSQLHRTALDDAVDKSEADQFEDLIGAGDNFDILEYADPELHSALSGHHDKSIFDEHLGIHKSSTFSTSSAAITSLSSVPLPSGGAAASSQFSATSSLPSVVSSMGLGPLMHSSSVTVSVSSLNPPGYLVSLSHAPVMTQAVGSVGMPPLVQSVPTFTHSSGPSDTAASSVSSQAPQLTHVTVNQVPTTHATHPLGTLAPPQSQSIGTPQTASSICSTAPTQTVAMTSATPFTSTPNVESAVSVTSSSTVCKASVQLVDDSSKCDASSKLAESVSGVKPSASSIAVDFQAKFLEFSKRKAAGVSGLTIEEPDLTGAASGSKSLKKNGEPVLIKKQHSPTVEEPLSGESFQAAEQNQAVGEVNSESDVARTPLPQVDGCFDCSTDGSCYSDDDDEDEDCLEHMDFIAGEFKKIGTPSIDIISDQTLIRLGLMLDDSLNKDEPELVHIWQSATVALQVDGAADDEVVETNKETHGEVNPSGSEAGSTIMPSLTDACTKLTSVGFVTPAISTSETVLVAADAVLSEPTGGTLTSSSEWVKEESATDGGQVKVSGVPFETSVVQPSPFPVEISDHQLESSEDLSQSSVLSVPNPPVNAESNDEGRQGNVLIPAQDESLIAVSEQLLMGPPAVVSISERLGTETESCEAQVSGQNVNDQSISSSVFPSAEHITYAGSVKETMKEVVVEANGNSAKSIQEYQQNSSEGPTSENAPVVVSDVQTPACVDMQSSTIFDQPGFTSFNLPGTVHGSVSPLTPVTSMFEATVVHFPVEQISTSMLPTTDTLAGVTPHSTAENASVSLVPATESFAPVVVSSSAVEQVSRSILAVKPVAESVDVDSCALGAPVLASAAETVSLYSATMMAPIGDSKPQLRLELPVAGQRHGVPGQVHVYRGNIQPQSSSGGVPRQMYLMARHQMVPQGMPGSEAMSYHSGPPAQGPPPPYQSKQYLGPQQQHQFWSHPRMPGPGMPLSGGGQSSQAPEWMRHAHPGQGGGQQEWVRYPMMPPPEWSGQQTLQHDWQYTMQTQSGQVPPQQQEWPYLPSTPPMSVYASRSMASSSPSVDQTHTGYQQVAHNVQASQSIVEHSPTSHQGQQQLTRLLPSPQQSSPASRLEHHDMASPRSSHSRTPHSISQPGTPQAQHPGAPGTPVPGPDSSTGLPSVSASGKVSGEVNVTSISADPSGQQQHVSSAAIAKSESIASQMGADGRQQVTYAVVSSSDVNLNYGLQNMSARPEMLQNHPGIIQRMYVPPPPGSRFVGQPPHSMYVHGPQPGGPAMFRMPSSTSGNAHSAIGALLNQQRQPVPGMSIHYVQRAGPGGIDQRYQLLTTTTSQDGYLHSSPRPGFPGTIMMQGPPGSGQRGVAPLMNADQQGGQEFNTMTRGLQSQLPPHSMVRMQMCVGGGPPTSQMMMRPAQPVDGMQFRSQGVQPSHMMVMVSNSEVQHVAQQQQPQSEHLMNHEFPDQIGVYRTKLVGEQPLLLEDLLEQEKQEQRRNAEQMQTQHQHSSQPSGQPLAQLSLTVSSNAATSIASESQPDASTIPSGSMNSGADTSAILTDADVDKLNVDVLSEDFRKQLPMTLPEEGQMHHHQQQLSQQQPYNHVVRQVHPDEQWLHRDGTGTVMAMQPGYPPRLVVPQLMNPRMQPPSLQSFIPGPSTGSVPVYPPSNTLSVPTEAITLTSFNTPAPPRPPDPPQGELLTEEDHQSRAKYDEWLQQMELWLSSNIHSLEQQVIKFRRTKKALNAKQRVARKNGNELSDSDAQILVVTGQEQSFMQKQLDLLRKQHRNHRGLMNDAQPKQPERFMNQWGQSSEGVVLTPPFVNQQQIAMQQPVSNAGLTTTPPGMAVKPMSNPIASPRTPGVMPPVRLTPAARQEYEEYVRSRLAIRQPGPRGIATPIGPIGPPSQPTIHTTITQGDENNPFSESYQQRERMEKLQRMQFEQQHQRPIDHQAPDRPGMGQAGMFFDKQGQPQRLCLPPEMTHRYPGPHGTGHMVYTGDGAMPVQPPSLNGPIMRHAIATPHVLTGPVGGVTGSVSPAMNPTLDSRISSSMAVASAQHSHQGGLVPSQQADGSTVYVLSPLSCATSMPNSSNPQVFHKSLANAHHQTVMTVPSNDPSHGLSYSVDAKDQISNVPVAYPSLSELETPPKKKRRRRKKEEMASSGDGAVVSSSGNSDLELNPSMFMSQFPGGRMSLVSPGANPGSLRMVRPNATSVAFMPALPASGSIRLPPGHVLQIQNRSPCPVPLEGRGMSDLQTFVNCVRPPQQFFQSDMAAPSGPTQTGQNQFSPGNKRFAYEQRFGAPLDHEQAARGVHRLDFGGDQSSSVTLKREKVFDGEDIDGKLINNNVVLKKLLNSKKSHDQFSTSVVGSGSMSYEDEENIQLTPEQQRQLELIESMPFTVAKEQDDSEPHCAEERENILELRRQEFERRRKELAEQQPKTVRPRQRRNKPEPVPTGPVGDGLDRTPKKRQKKLALQTAAVVVAPPLGPTGTPPSAGKAGIDRLSSGVDYSTMAEQLLHQLQQLSSVSLQEPEVQINYAVWLMLSTSVFSDGSANSVSSLKGGYGSAMPQDMLDYYSSPPFVSKLPATEYDVKETTSSTDSSAVREQKVEVEGVDAGVKDRSSNHSINLVTSIMKDQQSRSSSIITDSIRMPSPPLLEPHYEALSRMSDQSPSTIISSSSPELPVESQFDHKTSSPWLHLIPDSMKSKNMCTSPEIPLVCPTPVKAMKTHDFDSNRFPLDKSNCKSFSIDMNGRGFKPHVPLGSDNDKNQVSVMLTLSASAAENIGGVIAAIADLLRIAVPPLYEITRSPSPPAYSTNSSSDIYRFGFIPGVKHKEEAINIQSLMKSRTKFCHVCSDVVTEDIDRLSKPNLFEAASDEQAMSIDDFGEVAFCSEKCCKQFRSMVPLASPQTQQQPTSMASDHDPASTNINNEITPSDTLIKQNSEPKLAPTPPPMMSSSPSDTASSLVSHQKPIKLSICLGPQQNAVTIVSGPTLSTKGRKAFKHKFVDHAEEEKSITKRSKEVHYKRWVESMVKAQKFVKVTTEKELYEIMDRLTPVIRPKARTKDSRKCALCHVTGDAPSNGPGRLLNVDADKWVHLNCALWSNEVYETMNGALMYVDLACKRGTSSDCIHCHKPGATIGCFRPRCPNVYHIACAQLENVSFYQDKSVLCAVHGSKSQELDGHQLSSVAVFRRVYINRDENIQVARIMRNEEKKHAVRLGGLIVHSIGQLLPYQIHSGFFHSTDCIYPVGYKAVRYYWSYRQINKRCRYICKIEDVNGRPEFVVSVMERGMEHAEMRVSSCSEIAQQLMEPLEKMRRENDLVKVFPSFMTGEDFLGLTDPSVLKIIESLPGIEMLSSYHFRYGRSSIYKLPLAVNPSGCARSETRMKAHFKKPHTLHGAGNCRSIPSTVTVMPGDVNSPYLKQFVHSKSQQYRRLKTEWRNNIYLRRSNVQGLGLFAARDLEKHTMVIEYIGQLIRNEVAELREKIYEKQNHGVYMFRISENFVVDATMSGGLARYINHSCHPNCVAEVVHFEKDSKIIIIAKRKIAQGEELAYDYKFDFEDDQHKIPCLCGAPNCRKWMN